MKVLVDINDGGGKVVNTPPKATAKKKVVKASPSALISVNQGNSIEKPINYKFYLDDGTDITSHIGNPVLEDSTSTLAQSLSFQWIADGYLLECGDKIIVAEDEVKIFNGIVTSFSLGMNNEYSAKCYDYAFYLNKSEMIIQFNEVRADTAIRQMCSKAGIKLGSVCSISTKITQIYYGKTPANILKDILNKAYNELGKNYRFEMKNNALYIEEYKNLTIDLSKELQYASISCEKSIEEMKNAIVIVVNDDEDYIYCSTRDEASIKKYGLLQKVQSVSADNAAQARNTMNVLKNNLNRVQQTFSIQIPVVKGCRSGRVFKLDYEPFKVSGNFLINSCKKNLYGDFYMDLEVGLIEAKAGV